MGKLTQKILDVIYPPSVTCSLCGKEALCNGKGFCEECAKGLKQANVTVESKNIRAFFCGVEYTENMVRAVHMLKFNDARYVCATLAALIELPDDIALDAIVPVPLHIKRQHKRGYNQSALLAHKLGERYGLPVKEKWLVRTKYTSGQRNLSKEERAENIKGAFLAKGDVKGKNILLVDDVITTGATVNECALALLAAGAAVIYAAAPCATTLHGEML